MRRLELSHLDLCCLQKPIIIACGSERVKHDLIVFSFHFFQPFILYKDVGMYVITKFFRRFTIFYCGHAMAYNSR